MPARPLTRAQNAENRRFLKALADTGNARLAARSLGLNRSTFTKRRVKHADFAQSWEAALAAAHARFHLSGGERLPQILPINGEVAARSDDGGGAANAPRSGELDTPLHRCAVPLPTSGEDYRTKSRTKGGEPTIIRRANGKLQLRLAQPGQITRATEQAFLRALSATANIRLSAKAAGVSYPTIYKRREDSEAFRREMKRALEIGFERLELVALRAGDLDRDPYDDWLDGDELPLPRMSIAEILQLLALHRNQVKLGWDAPHRRKRRNETRAQYGMRLQLMWKAEQRNLRKQRAAARGEAYERTGSWRLEGDWPEVAELPDLRVVTGWSKAKPKTELAKGEEAKGKGMFGGWTVDDLEKRRAGG